MNKFYNGVVIATVVATLGGAVMPALTNNGIQADTTQSADNVAQPNVLSDKDISNFDQYVTVENNQYVLNLPKDNTFSDSKIAEVQYSLEKANQSVIEHNLRINQLTKTSQAVVMGEDAKYTFLDSKSSHSFTFKNFWWGTRYYFTSNAAVNDFVHDFQDKSIVLGALGAAGAIGGVIPALVGAAGAAYFAKVANDLNYYNQRHSKSRIYLDMNYSLGYSFHVY